MEGKIEMQKMSRAVRSSFPVTHFLTSRRALPGSSSWLVHMYAVFKLELPASRRIAKCLFLFRSSEVISHVSNEEYILVKLKRMTCKRSE